MEITSHSLQGPEVFESSKAKHSLTEAGPKITKVSGYSDGVGVVNGIYQGQPSWAPSWASNKYKGMLGMDASSSINAYWDIVGTGFGSVKKSVTIVNSSGSTVTDFAITTVSWSDTKIKVLVTNKKNHQYQFITNVSIKVTLSSTSASVYKPVGIVGLYKGRPYGQCTWWVASNRLRMGLQAPPSAYSTTASILYSYEPKLNDCLTYGTKHVAYISTAPVKKINTDGSIEYSFKVAEMNAKWDESSSTFSATFKVSKLVNGKRTIITQIGSNSGLKATGYYR